MVSETRQLRELRAEDAEQVAALFAECYGASRLVDGEEVRSWARNTEFEPAWLRVLEEDGRIVGYGDIFPHDDVVELDLAAPGCFETIFVWAEEEARTRGVPFVRVQIPDGHELARFVEGRGYEPWRHSLTMELELDGAPEVTLPSQLELRAYRERDKPALIEALNEAFADDPFWHTVTPANFAEFYVAARGFDPRLWSLAWAGDELAGFSLGYSERGGDPTLGWVGTLGVRSPWRRRGLGEALLRSSFAALYAWGLRRVGLGVHADNPTGALRLYERVGMRVVRRAYNWRKHV